MCLVYLLMWHVTWLIDATHHVYQHFMLCRSRRLECLCSVWHLPVYENTHHIDTSIACTLNLSHLYTHHMLHKLATQLHMLVLWLNQFYVLFVHKNFISNYCMPRLWLILRSTSFLYCHIAIYWTIIMSASSLTIWLILIWFICHFSVHWLLHLKCD